LVWHAPGALFVDRDLLLKSRTSVEAAFLGPHAQFLSFSGTRYIVRRANGALFHGWVPPFTSKLQALVVAGQWMQAARLCRFAKEPALWAALAALALDGQELETAALALSAIDEYDKLEFVQQLVQIPTVEGRNAELALFRRRPDDAEAICLQAGLVYRAVKLNLRLFRWERALELAQHYKAHLDTVLAYRDRYLRATRGTETLRRFAELSKEIKWDWATVAAREEQELQRERAAGAAYRPPSLPRQPSAEFSPQASAPASGDGYGAVY
jgi:intraflagellar transport protein 80